MDFLITPKCFMTKDRKNMINEVKNADGIAEIKERKIPISMADIE